MTERISNVYHAYVINFGLWLHDPQTMRSYALDIRPYIGRGMLTGIEADEFRVLIDAEAARMTAE